MTGRQDRRCIRTGRAGLAAACLAAAALVGCGSSDPTMQAVEKAIRTANAAGRAQVTGQAYDRVAAAPESELGPNGPLDQRAVAGLKNKEGWKQYIDRKEMDTDLKAAGKMLSDALSGGNPSPQLRSVIQSQSGGVAMRQAELRLADLQEDLASLSQQAMGLQEAGQAVALLMLQAESQSAAAQAPEPTEADQARSAAAAMATETATVQQKVGDLEKQLAAYMDQGRQIALKAAGDFRAAESLKGQAAVDAGQKALETYKQANAAIEAAAKIEPALAQARAALELAQARQRVAEDRAKTLADVLEQKKTAAGNAAGRATALRAQAKELVEGKDGIAVRYKAFNDLAAALEKKIQGDGSDRGAAYYADAADRAYADAKTQWGSYLSSVKELNLDSADPLAKIGGDQRQGAFLSWSQALAKERGGRIQLSGYVAAGLQSGVAASVTAAYKAAGVPDPGAKAALDAAKYRKEAADRFAAAMTVAKAGTDVGGITGLQWLGYTVQAVALQGTYSITASSADRTAMVDAANKASAANPMVKGQMDGLVGGP